MWIQERPQFVEYSVKLHQQPASIKILSHSKEESPLIWDFLPSLHVSQLDLSRKSNNSICSSH